MCVFHAKHHVNNTFKVFFRMNKVNPFMQALDS